MQLKIVEFYQSVRLWDNQERKTVDLNTVSSIRLHEHLVELRMADQEEVIVIPTANMRHGRFVDCATNFEFGDSFNIDPSELFPKEALAVLVDEKVKPETLEVVGVDHKERAITLSKAKKKK